MNVFPFGHKRDAPSGGSIIGMWLNGEGKVPTGYTRLLDCPEIQSCINAIVDPISSATIYLMENTSEGDKRIKSELARFLDIEPCPMMGTRREFIAWIATEMLIEGNALVLPHYAGNSFSYLEPMPSPCLIGEADRLHYKVQWRGREFQPDEIVHFRLYPSSSEPWKGRGLETPLKALASSLANTDALKNSLCSPDYKPPMVIMAETDSDLSSKTARDSYRKSFLEDNEPGKPWILPMDFAKIQELKPLTLSDLCIKDTIELDKKSLCSIFGVPPFLLGLGAFNQQEYNLFIARKVRPLAEAIEKTFTASLIYDSNRYFQFSRRRLFFYDLSTLLNVDLNMMDRGVLTGDEVREDAHRDPAGLTEFRALENFIPYDMAAQQSKLQGGKTDGN